VVIGAAAAFTIPLGSAPVAAHPGHSVQLYAAGLIRGAAQTNTRAQITVCDLEADGKRVRAQLRDNASGNIFYTAWASGGGRCTPQESHPVIDDFRVCAETFGCTAWHSYR
jgi:hypothetical protein